MATIYDNLAHKKISSLFWQYALPAIIGTCVTTLYNIIDGVFIGHWLGIKALQSTGLLLPIMNFLAGIGMLVGIGSASRISIFLGQNNRVMAEKLIGISLLLNLTLNGIAILFFLAFMDPILYLAGASEETLPYAEDFLLIFLPGNLFLSLMFNYNHMMRASGHPLKAMITLFITVICNIILAPIFIKWLNLGMKGAALATVISMVIGFIFVFQHFCSKNSIIRFKWQNVRFSWTYTKSIIAIGFSPFCMQIAASFIIVIINSQLKHYALNGPFDGDMAIGAFSNANRLMLLITMIVIGINQGMQPIIGYNYGATNYHRVFGTFRYAAIIATIVTTTGFLLSYFIPDLLMYAFTDDAFMIEVSGRVLHDIMLAFPIIGFPIVIISLFQSINMPKISIALSLTRQIIILIPMLYIVPKHFGFDGVLYAMPISDVISSIISISTFFIFYHHLKKQWGKSFSQTEN